MLWQEGFACIPEPRERLDNLYQPRFSFANLLELVFRHFDNVVPAVNLKIKKVSGFNNIFLDMFNHFV